MQQSLHPSKIKEIVRRHWAGRAPTFDQAPNHGLYSDEQRAAWRSRVKGWTRRFGRDDWAISSRSKAISGCCTLDALDVGCGTGFLALLLAELGHRVTGVDAADEMLDRAREKAARAELAAAFRRADAVQLPFSDGSFACDLTR